MSLRNGGKGIEVVDTHVVALYQPETGRIVHMHQVTVFKGGRAVNEEQAIEFARAQATRSGTPADRLRVKVSKDPEHGRGPHRIDLATGTFVRIAVAKPKR